MKVKWLLTAGPILGIVLYVLGLVLLGKMQFDAAVYALVISSCLLVVTATVWIIRKIRNRKRKGG